MSRIVLRLSSIFLSTPSARRATRPPRYFDKILDISIHTLREEGDARPRSLLTAGPNFYPHPPRGGRRRRTGRSRKLQHFYPHPPRGGRLSHQFLCDFYFNISIHTLREEGDRPLRGGCRCSKVFLSTPSARRATTLMFFTRFAVCVFLSTPSARRATYGKNCNNVSIQISIHTLREEGDR